MRIGIYGGTFDPVHYGHLRPAMDVYEAFALGQIRFIPCGQPPHRELPVASAAQRLAMLQCAVADNPAFVVDDREIRRRGPSYMIDTLNSLRSDMPGAELYLILGMDAFAAFDRWHHWQDIPALCKLIVTHRPAFEPDKVTLNSELQKLVAARQVAGPAELAQGGAGALTFYPVTQLAISATDIRAAIRQQHSIKYLLPDTVAAMINEQGIYH